MASRIRIEETDPAYRGTAAAGAEYAVINRIHWGAIFAGALLAVAVAFGLNLLGIGIGLSTINPTDPNDSFSGLGIGAIIWYVVSTLIALFAGGYVAGRLSGFPKKSTAGLHGLVTWALFTLLSLYLLNSAIGSLFNVVGSTLSTAASATGSVVSAAVPDDLGQQIRQQLNQSNISLADIRREASELLEQTDKAALDPDNLARDAQQSVDAAERTAADAAQSPYAANREINNTLDRIAQRGEQVMNAADKDALINVLVARTDMDEAEARRTVDGWAQQYDQAMQSVNQTLQQAGQTAKEVGGDVADTLATTAILGFVALLIGALAGFFGGAAGRQHDLTTGDGSSIRTTEAS